MKKLITIVCFCLSVPFLAQEANEKQDNSNNKTKKTQQATNLDVKDSKEDVKNDNQKAKAGTSGNIQSISKDDIKAPVSNNNASRQSRISKEKKVKEAPKDGGKKEVKTTVIKTVKSSEIKPLEVVKKKKKRLFRLLATIRNHQEFLKNQELLMTLKSKGTGFLKKKESRKKK
ncbi:hypothetical protein [Chryseobacterium sp. SL1]|uniref:hypothetical protein n=1 Tax=Chryseobacterium sp. SL1 TaxID=2995159 RepID=UPI002272A212|nr:hypothetical protein [Chryseobacterium sp. SL1]MCY1660924.1 hypothetical protein [Chryseobacterium sp. SL1]